MIIVVYIILGSHLSIIVQRAI